MASRIAGGMNLMGDKGAELIKVVLETIIISEYLADNLTKGGRISEIFAN
jgi:hypothetical protein